MVAGARGVRSSACTQPTRQPPQPCSRHRQAARPRLRHLSQADVLLLQTVPLLKEEGVLFVSLEAWLGSKPCCHCCCPCLLCPPCGWPKSFSISLFLVIQRGSSGQTLATDGTSDMQHMVPRSSATCYLECTQDPQYPCLRFSLLLFVRQLSAPTLESEQLIAILGAGNACCPQLLP